MEKKWTYLGPKKLDRWLVAIMIGVVTGGVIVWVLKFFMPALLEIF